jgi:hypothetical protein
MNLQSLRLSRIVTACVITLGLIPVLAGSGLAQAGSEGPSSATPPNSAGAVNERAASPAGKMIGVWEGTTLASCSVSLLPDRCNAQQKVKITVLEGDNGKLTGFYSCAYGTQNCFHMNETGKVVAATITGQQVMMRVRMPDGLSYIFNGRVTGERVNGGYTATSGGALLERGNWRATRTY